MLQSLQTNVISQRMIQNGAYKGKQFVFVDAWIVAIDVNCYLNFPYIFHNREKEAG